MSIQITIIGLRQVGTSIGLALKDHKELVRRVGHDRDPAAARQAEKLGALDHVSFNLPSAVRQADLVLLTEPLDQLLDTLKVIAADLREGTVVMDTAPVKAGLIEAASRLLPPERHYISLLPAINPAYLFEPSSGPETGRADLFKGGVILISHTPGTNPEAIKLASDLSKLLDADPLFTDPYEADGLSAAAILLPQLLSAALVNATASQPGWREARKVAGADYALASAPTRDRFTAHGLARALALNRENALRLVGDVSAGLDELRAALDAQDEDALAAFFEQAIDLRAEWLQQRTTASWQGEGYPQTRPPEGSILSRLFGSSLGRKPPAR